MFFERILAKEAFQKPLISESRKSIFRVRKILFKGTQPPCFHPLVSTLSNLLEGRWTFFFFLLTAKRRLKVAQGRSDRGSWVLKRMRLTRADKSWEGSFRKLKTCSSEMSSNANKVVQLHREALQRQTQQDWVNREYVELISGETQCWKIGL